MQPMIESSINDDKLLDELKEGFSLKNDAQIAEFLGITRATIHNVRHKKVRLGIMQRLKILDKIGFLKTRQLIESIAPKSLASLIESSSNKLVQRRLKDYDSQNDDDVLTDDAVLLNQVKVAFGFNTDQELAEFLGVARNTISMIRKGKSTLGPYPRLKILNKIAPFDLHDLEKTLASTELIISGIKDWQKLVSIKE